MASGPLTHAALPGLSSCLTQGSHACPSTRKAQEKRVQGPFVAPRGGDSLLVRPPWSCCKLPRAQSHTSALGRYQGLEGCGL